MALCSCGIEKLQARGICNLVQAMAQGATAVKGRKATHRRFKLLCLQRLQKQDVGVLPFQERSLAPQRCARHSRSAVTSIVTRQSPGRGLVKM
mmetsp:Transcript_6561/g.11179  ORF Transcript_6561/g.11179 Transcript_6561/m.11179 type:complete len:93 (+) Transcript_6561:267-545(+)